MSPRIIFQCIQIASKIGKQGGCICKAGTFYNQIFIVNSQSFTDPKLICFIAIVIIKRAEFEWPYTFYIVMVKVFVSNKIHGAIHCRRVDKSLTIKTDGGI